MSMSEVTRVIGWYPETCHPTAIEPLGSSGGLSGAIFWRLTTPRGTLCLRRWPAEHPTRDRLAWIHHAVRHAANECPFPLPVPIETARGATFAESDGRLWELTPWLEGDPLPASPPDLDRIPTAMVALAELHLALAAFAVSTGDQRNARTGSPPGIAKRLALVGGTDFPLLERAAASYRGEQELTGPLRRLAEILFRRWALLSASVLQELQMATRLSVILQPCLRDVWRPHVLFHDNAVSGIIDFGALDVDSVAADISRFLGSLACAGSADFEVWKIGLAAYAGVRPVSRDERLLIATYDRSGLVLAAVNWIRWLAVERRPFPPGADVVERLSRLAGRLDGHSSSTDTHPALL